MEMRVFNKEKQYLLKNYININSIITISALIFNVIICTYILNFNEFIQHAYVNLFIMLLVIWNLFVLKIKAPVLKIKKMEHHFIFMGIYLVINIVDSVKIFPEIALIYFFPYLIGFNIFYNQRKTIQLGVFIALLLILFYLTDSLFFKNLWSERKSNEENFTIYFIINVIVCLFLTVYYTYINVLIKYYKKDVMPIQEEDKTNYLNDLYEKILLHLKQKKPYLNLDYSLKTLANELNTNITYVSKAINSIDGQNFYHLINDYRIEDLKKEMQNDLKKDEQNYTLEYYYTKYGFKSQSTFNKAFKRNTGMTPSDYIINIKSNYESFIPQPTSLLSNSQ